MTHESRQSIAQRPPIRWGMAWARWLWAWLLLAALGACAAPHGTEQPWQAEFGRDHPLTGRIWDNAAGRYIGEAALLRRLAAAQYVVLGETHDNPDHHRLQARLIEGIVAAGRRPAIALEMIALDQADALAAQLARAPGDVDGVAEAVGWGESGWPEWAIYRPIAEAALAARLPLLAANLAPTTVRQLARGGLGAADPALVARLNLDTPISATERASREQEIRQAHCGYAPEEQLAGMVLAQHARDAQMADSLLRHGRAGGAVLIAGAGHARTDRGVPARIRQRSPRAAVLSLAFLEVAADTPEPTSDAAHRGEAELPFDFVWFTARVDERDPCERFKEQLERMRHSSEEKDAAFRAIHDRVESRKAATAARRLSGAPAQVRTVRSAAVSKKTRLVPTKVEPI